MEDIAKEHGQKLRKGRLGADGDIEFYDEDAEAKVAHAETKVA
jgi:protein import protein ZIM17